MNTNYLMKEKNLHLFYEVLLNKKSLIYCDPNQNKFHKHEIIYSYVYTYSYINFLTFKLKGDLY